MLGLAAGTCFHVAAAALGVSAILLASALAFDLVKYAGAAYLIYLGIRKLVTRDTAMTADDVKPERLQSVFFQGILVNILNPKTALFFFAFLPQFVNPAAGRVVGQILLLGLIFIALSLITDTCYALLAGGAGEWIRRNRVLGEVQRYLTACVYLGLGVATAVSGPARK